VPGRLCRLNLTTGAKMLITQQPTGNIDVLESDGRGGYMVSDQLDGCVRRGWSSKGYMRTATESGRDCCAASASVP
jgi:hypothetical protein